MTNPDASPGIATDQPSNSRPSSFVQVQNPSVWMVSSVRPLALKCALSSGVRVRDRGLRSPVFGSCSTGWSGPLLLSAFFSCLLLSSSVVVTAVLEVRICGHVVSLRRVFTEAEPLPAWGCPISLRLG